MKVTRLLRLPVFLNVERLSRLSVYLKGLSSESQEIVETVGILESQNIVEIVCIFERPQ